MIRFEGVRAQLSRQKKTFASAIKRFWPGKGNAACYLEFKNTKTVLS